MKKIGFAVEETYGVGSPGEEIIRTDIQKTEPIIAKKYLVCSARFKCPSCGKTIAIEIRDEENPGQPEEGSNMYGIRFDFDCEGEPPSVLIAADCGEGTAYVEVFEEPKSLSAGWSMNPKDWEAGPMAQSLVNFLNTASVQEDTEGEWKPVPVYTERSKNI